MRGVGSQANAFQEPPKTGEGGREIVDRHVAVHAADPDAVSCAHC